MKSLLIDSKGATAPERTHEGVRRFDQAMGGRNALAEAGDGVGNASNGKGTAACVDGIHTQAATGKGDACAHAQWQLAPACQHGAASASTAIGTSAAMTCVAATLTALRSTTATSSRKHAVANAVLPSTNNAHSHTLTARR